VSAGQGNWVNPQLLVRRQGADRRLMQRSLMVRADDQGQRLWAIDLALRCGAVTAVVADATGLKMPATRRLQLAAAGGDGIALLGRCRRELNVPSAAATRWSVSRRPSQHGPGWVVELLRCKGSQPANAAAGDSPAMAGHPHQPRWMLEWDGAAGAVIIPADVVERPGSQGQKLPAQQRRASRIA
jgi:protein ImuA